MRRRALLPPSSITQSISWRVSQMATSRPFGRLGRRESRPAVPGAFKFGTAFSSTPFWAESMGLGSDVTPIRLE
jgi:hypothetical protein